MNFVEPPPSPYDLRFRLFGFPIRIHVLFWFAAIILGLGGGDRGTPPAELVAWIAVLFTSILVHELGHAFVQRRFGGHPWITLHAFGGLAACDDCDRSSRSQILISLAGPAAGFALALLVAVLLKGTGHDVGFAVRRDQLPATGPLIPMPMLGGLLYWSPLAKPAANLVVANLFWINILWGVVNLLPIYPLDGGRVARELFTHRGNVRDGIILSLRVSLVAAAAMAIYGLVAWQSVLTALMFGSLAQGNYLALKSYAGRGW